MRFIFQSSPPSITVHVSIIGPALAECLKDSSTPVRLAAERCVVHVFQMTKVFPVYIDSVSVFC